MTLHSFELILQRSNLDSEFTVANQEINTDLLFKSELLYTLEKLINKELFDTEAFKLTAMVTLDTKLQCIDKKLTMRVKVFVKEVLNFDQDNILPKPLQFSL